MSPAAPLILGFDQSPHVLMFTDRNLLADVGGLLGGILVDLPADTADGMGIPAWIVRQPH